MVSVRLGSSRNFGAKIRTALGRPRQMAFQGRYGSAWRCSSHRGDIVLVRHSAKSQHAVETHERNRPQKRFWVIAFKSFKRSCGVTSLRECLR